MIADLNTPLWQLTVGEFQDLVRSELVAQTKNTPTPTQENREVVKGLDTMAKRIGVSKSTLNSYKQRGWLDGCYTQMGRTIFFDVEKVMFASKKLQKKCVTR